MDWGVLGGEGDRIWRGGIAIEMEGDRGGLHKFFLAFKKLFDTYFFIRRCAGCGGSATAVE